MNLKVYTQDAISLLKDLIATPSFSSEEHKTAKIISHFLENKGVDISKSDNNIIAYNKHFNSSKPTLLLNSHHDTVKPNKGYKLDPFSPIIKKGKLFGLGSNDAGGPLVSLINTFLYFYDRDDLNHNIVLVASGEEESSGERGLNSTIDNLPKIDLAIIGEPTKMQMAIAEKGLVVFDAIVEGTPSHAAHPNNDNVIYNLIDVLTWFKEYRFEKVSHTLGAVKMTVTQIESGSQHNVVPAQANLVVDVRVNDCYQNQEIVSILQNEAPCQSLKPRTLKLNSSSINSDHKIIAFAKKMNIELYGSPTLSDQAMLTCPSVKIGPGSSTRSHTADEYIFIDEIENGIKTYITLLESYLKSKTI